MNNIELCKNIWERLYRPNSACPDVELGRVLEVMVDSLVGIDSMVEGCQHLETLEERWAVTYISVSGKSTQAEICILWAGRVPQYLQDPEGGCPKARDWEEYERDVESQEALMKKALEGLIEQGVLREEAHPELGVGLVLASEGSA